MQASFASTWSVTKELSNIAKVKFLPRSTFSPESVQKSVDCSRILLRSIFESKNCISSLTNFRFGSQCVHYTLHFRFSFPLLPFLLYFFSFLFFFRRSTVSSVLCHSFLKDRSSAMNESRTASAMNYLDVPTLARSVPRIIRCRTPCNFAKLERETPFVHCVSRCTCASLASRRIQSSLTFLLPPFVFIRNETVSKCSRIRSI